MRQVVVTVDADGNVTVEAVGFKGKSCAQATAAIEAALGKVKGKQWKPEAKEQNHVRTGN